MRNVRVNGFVARRDAVRPAAPHAGAAVPPAARPAGGSSRRRRLSPAAPVAGVRWRYARPDGGWAGGCVRRAVRAASERLGRRILPSAELAPATPPAAEHPSAEGPASHRLRATETGLRPLAPRLVARNVPCFATKGPAVGDGNVTRRARDRSVRRWPSLSPATSAARAAPTGRVTLPVIIAPNVASTSPKRGGRRCRHRREREGEARSP